MVIAFLQWWYGAGWVHRAHAVRDRLAGVMDTFSIDLLLKTLFSPFRQISADAVDGPINVRFRAWIDKLISRIIGAIVRLLTILAGVVTLILFVIWGLIMLALWPLLPLVPFIGIILGITGWMPWTA